MPVIIDNNKFSKMLVVNTASLTPSDIDLLRMNSTETAGEGLSFAMVVAHAEETNPDKALNFFCSLGYVADESWRREVMKDVCDTGSPALISFFEQATELGDCFIRFEFGATGPREETLMTISTAHFSDEDLSFLGSLAKNDEKKMHSKDDDPYDTPGYWFSVNSKMPSLPPRIEAIVDFARRNGVDTIEIDRDGPEFSEFEIPNSFTPRP